MCAAISNSEAGFADLHLPRGLAPDLITSRRNPLVGRLRALHQPRGRLEQGLVLLEGTHLVQEVVRLQLVPELVLATVDWLNGHPQLVEALVPQVRIQPLGPEALAAIATTEHPDGVALVLPTPQLSSPPVTDLVLALDRLQDPGNLGTLIRTALAAGVGELWLAAGADPWQPKVLRASAGAALALPVERLHDSAALVTKLERARTAGVQVLAAVVRGGVPYWELDWSRPTVLLLGNEGAGLAPELLQAASHRVSLPHSPDVESLNVAVAAAPLLLERWRRAQGG